MKENGQEEDHILSSCHLSGKEESVLSHHRPSTQGRRQLTVMAWSWETQEVLLKLQELPHYPAQGVLLKLHLSVSGVGLG